MYKLKIQLNKKSYEKENNLLQNINIILKK